MEIQTKLNIIIVLLILIFLMQLFLKPEVYITDNNLGISLAVDELKEQLINMSCLK